MLKNIIKIKNILNDQQGQALVFVIGTMVVALAIGVGVSVRTLSSISRVSTTDTASRVLAAAEGGIENLLTLSTNDLQNLADSGNVTTITYNPPAGSADTIVTKADVAVESFGDTSYPDSYDFIVERGQTFEVKLGSYTGSNIEICWLSTRSSVESTDIYVTAYGGDNSGGYEIEKQGVNASDRIGKFPVTYDNSFDSANSCNHTGYNDFDSYTFSLPSDASYLRIRALNASANVAVFPASGAGNLPTQGFEITSIGSLENDPENTQPAQQVKAYYTLQSLPGMFDFGLYSDAGSIR